jgi:hypothetical protein
MAQHDVAFTDYCTGCGNGIPRVCGDCYRRLSDQNERAIKLLTIAHDALSYLADDAHLIPFPRTLARDTLAQMADVED